MELVRPEFVADDKNRWCAGSEVCRSDRSTEQRRDAERLEGAGRDGGGVHFFGATGLREVSSAPDYAEHVLEGMVVFFEIDEGARGETPGPELVGGVDGERGETVGV